MTAKVKTEKSVRDYENLTDREHALQRAGMYMGSVSKQDLVRMIFNPERNCYEQRTLSLSEGFETIFDEILVNALDQQNKDHKMNEIRVNIFPDHIVIKNNGQGLPLDEKKEVSSTHEIVWLPTMLFGRFRSSENFNDNRQGAGLNGIGAKIVNCYCREFSVETQHPKSRKYFSQTWRNNMGEEGKPTRRGITSNDEKGGFVKITMWPDFEKFEMKKIDPDTMQLLRSRVYDAAGFLRNGLSVYLNDELVPVKTFAEYSDLFFGPDIPRATCSIKDADNKSMTRLEISIAHSNDGFRCHGLVNGLRTPDGSHVKAIVNDQLGKAIVDNLSRKRDYKDMKFQPAQFKDQIFLLVKMTVDNPEFNSQRKTEFVSKPSTWGFPLEFTQAFIKKLESPEMGIVPAMVALKDFKDNRALAQITKTPKKGRILDIKKLHDAENINKPNRQKTLIITEGDSALELAKAGIVALENSGDYGLYPLRGKSLNVRGATQSAVMANELAVILMRILGVEWKKVYQSVNQLRYQRVLIWSDADPDGAHITALFMNFVHALWPSILEVCPDFCVMMISPIGKATRKGVKKAVPIYFFTPHAASAWISTQTPSQLKKYDLQYIKGLGTNEPRDAKYYFRNIDTFAVPLRYTGAESDEIIDMVFNSKRADDRKEWINNTYDPELFLPLGEEMECITWPDFINQHFIHFSVVDGIRSLPSVVDGFKPSQRKTAWTFFSGNITDVKRVNALVGAVMERSAYHHGEISIGEAIIHMAQAYIGTNNINLLQPNGLFGTRENCRTGNDSNHAATRYIFSCLEPIARAIFLKEDDALLSYLDDDGKSIEPKFYQPILPMLLVNGSSGIGTGWSCDVPKYHPLDVVTQVEGRIKHWHQFAARFEEQELTREPPQLDPWPQTLQPWYDCFKGTVERAGPFSFELRGQFSRTSDSVHVTELPPEVFTEKWLESIKKQYVIGASLDAEKTTKSKAKKTGKAKAAGKKTGKAKGAGKKTAKPKSKDASEEEETTTTSRKKAVPSHEFIKDVNKQLKGSHNISVIFQCDPAKLAKLSDTDLVGIFKLGKKVGFTNAWVFDINGKLRKFHSPEEVIDYFCYHRMPVYERRKAILEEQLRYDSVELKNKRRYLEMVMGYGGKKPYNVGGKSIEQVTRELEAMGFDKLTLRPKYRDSEEKTIKQEEASYWYLGKLAQWSTTEEKINQLRRECDEALNKLAHLQASTPADLWLADLAHFRTAYEEFVKRKLYAMNDNDDEEDGGDGAPKKKAKKSRKVKTEPTEKKRKASDKTSAPKRMKVITSSGKSGKK